MNSYIIAISKTIHTLPLVYNADLYNTDANRSIRSSETDQSWLRSSWRQRAAINIPDNQLLEQTKRKHIRTLTSRWRSRVIRCDSLAPLWLAEVNETGLWTSEISYINAIFKTIHTTSIRCHTDIIPTRIDLPSDRLKLIETDRDPCDVSAPRSIFETTSYYSQQFVWHARNGPV